MKFKFIMAVLALFCCLAQAQVEVVDTTEGSETKAPTTGKKAAQEYFKKRQKPLTDSDSEKSNNRKPAAAAATRYLALHVGSFIQEDAYKWGRRNNDDLGKLNFGVTYRVGEWENSMDLLFRADFTTFDLNEGKATKLSLLPLITFPDAKSGFPLYFGAGLGLGVFFKQIEDESALSFDYQLVAGTRFFDVVQSVGFMAEVGMKNHILLLSDGQYNGVFLNVGAVFAF